jgi:hypothetical protein
LSPADDQVDYFFNSWEFGHSNEPRIHVTAAPLLKITLAQFTNGVFHIAGIGARNVPYKIQTGSEFSTTNWQTLATITTDSSGLLQFDDASASNQTRRFYRLSN